jgi:hypothetical protein
MVKCLQPRGSFPFSCDKRVVEILNSVCTQLTNNEWIYFVPLSESVTILCMDKPPVDVLISGIGKLGISTNCKGLWKICIISDTFHTGCR